MCAQCACSSCRCNVTTKSHAWWRSGHALAAQGDSLSEHNYTELADVTELWLNFKNKPKKIVSEAIHSTYTTYVYYVNKTPYTNHFDYVGCYNIIGSIRNRWKAGTCVDSFHKHYKDSSTHNNQEHQRTNIIHWPIGPGTKLWKFCSTTLYNVMYAVV